MVATQLRLPALPNSYVQFDGGAIAEVYEWGEGSPLVVVPGLAGGALLVQPLLTRLSKYHRVITYQLRGEREGMLVRPFGFDQHAEDLSQVISQLRLEQPAIYGFSFGGAVALEFAVRYPGRCSLLAVQGVGPTFHAGMWTNVVRSILQRMRLPTDSYFINQFLAVLLGRAPKPEDRFDAIVQQIWTTDQSTMARRIEQLNEFDVSDHLWTVDVPTLVIAGEKDVVVPVPQAEELANALPNAELHKISDAGHLASVTHSLEVANLLLAFQITAHFV